MMCSHHNAAPVHPALLSCDIWEIWIVYLRPFPWPSLTLLHPLREFSYSSRFFSLYSLFNPINIIHHGSEISVSSTFCRTVTSEGTLCLKSCVNTTVNIKLSKLQEITWVAVMCNVVLRTRLGCYFVCCKKMARSRCVIIACSYSVFTRNRHRNRAHNK